LASKEDKLEIGKWRLVAGYFVTLAAIQRKRGLVSIQSRLLKNFNGKKK
jgi:hypothetical protein